MLKLLSQKNLMNPKTSAVNVCDESKTSMLFSSDPVRQSESEPLHWAFLQQCGCDWSLQTAVSSRTCVFVWQHHLGERRGEIRSLQRETGRLRSQFSAEVSPVLRFVCLDAERNVNVYYICFICFHNLTGRKNTFC